MKPMLDLTEAWHPDASVPALGDVLLGVAGTVFGELPKLRLRAAGGDRRSTTSLAPGVAEVSSEEQLALVNPSAEAARSRLGLPEAKRAVVVLTDGLGWHNLQSRPDLAPFLTQRMLGQVGTSALPSTTAANITYLGTGVLPGQTGMAGYTVRNPATRKQANLISWTGLPDPVDWQRVPTVFERLSAGGAPSAHVSTWRFENSGLTQAGLRGADYFAAESLAERVDATVELVVGGEHLITYLYWADVDASGHQHGWKTPIWEHELRRVDLEIERLARNLPRGTLLILTADHGMVDVPAHESTIYSGPARFDIAEHSELRTDIDLVAGENRFLHLFTSQPERVAARWQNFLGSRAIISTRTAAFTDDEFGPVRADIADVIGDVTVKVLGDLSIGDSRIMSAGMRNLPGLHGSVTELERAIPILSLVT